MDIDNNLNKIGNILYELNDENKLKIIEINKSFLLRKEKIRHKTWKQSTIYSLIDNPNVIYIESLNKWYYNKELFKNKVIEVELYDSWDDIIFEEDNLQQNEENILLDNLIHHGYIVYNIINYNYISCRIYTSRLMMEQELDSERKPHISEIFIDKKYEDIFFIKELDKWFVKPQHSNSEFSQVKLYNSVDEIKDAKDKSINVQFIQEDENDVFRRDDITRLNINSIHKDLRKLGYMLLEFTSVNHIKYQIFDSYEDAEEKLTFNSQVTKCYHKKNNPDIIFIKLLKKWIYRKEENAKLYSSDMDIPINTIKEELEININKTKNTFKQIVKDRNLVLVGWIYYEVINDNQVKARHYTSSNDLLNRLDNGGNESQLFKSKLENIFYIKELNKWYKLDENLEKKDRIIKIKDEKEIFK